MVQSPYSYLVDLGYNGSVRHMHANKMRHFITRVQGCGVIAECDAEFGKVLSSDAVVDESVLPSVRVTSEKDESQRAELLEVLDEFAACFLDKPGLCDVVNHRIVTTPDFVSKQMKPYRVPVAFQSEVNRELLDMGLIRPSVGPMASPCLRCQEVRRWLLKRLSTHIAPSICHVRNLSLQSGVFPAQLKQARVIPLLKKATMDPDTTSSYRPISNLPYLPKLIEQVVASRFTSHTSDFSLLPA